MLAVAPAGLFIDRNGATIQVAGDSGGVFQRHTDGKLWKWDGHSACDAGGCPGLFLSTATLLDGRHICKPAGRCFSAMPTANSEMERPLGL